MSIKGTKCIKMLNRIKSVDGIKASAVMCIKGNKGTIEIKSRDIL